MTVSENYLANSPLRVVQYILPKLGMMFSRTKTSCFENSAFLTLGLGMREGVSEGSRRGSGWVTFSSISCRHLSRDLHVLLECVLLPLHVHLGGE